MTESPSAGESGDFAADVDVRHENLLLRRRLAQRDAALVGLNRRLRTLERGQTSSENLPADSQQRIKELEEELIALRNTKTFRYTEQARRLYGRTIVRWVSR